ncbi:P-type ATPase [Enhygromyxa salina]|uniref:Putative cobalt/nickel-exporting P-type ATPase n=1 Tax=Enhygromyxa salina TaxID=215803 RepID=A0A2S9YTP4_9BACT|nr:HAD family hydrolase [Enhygromyxa salina]PRQ08458.1 putative cobalt/nickel-exporting P-type ATPase [Enhygromyxa salina]
MLLLNLLWAGAALFTSRELVRFIADEEPEPEPEFELEPDPAAQLDDGAASVVVIPGSSGPGPSENPNEDPAEAGRALVLSVGALALAGVGSLGLSVARWTSWGLALTAGLPIVRRAWRNFEQERRLDYRGLVCLQGIGALALGYPGLAALDWMIYAGAQRSLASARARARGRSEHPLIELEDHAWLVDERAEILVHVNDLRPGDRVIVKADERVPVDGHVVSGAVRVDARLLTAATHARERSVGDELLAGAWVVRGAAIVEVARSGEQTLAARLVAVNAELAPSSADSTALQVERDAQRSVRPTLAIAGFGLLSAGPIGALIGCHTNLVEVAYWTSPAHSNRTLAAAARDGIVVEDARALERLADVDVVVLDTDTILARSQLEVMQIHAHGSWRAPDVLGIAAALEGGSAGGGAGGGEDVGEDPLARALARALERLGAPTAEVQRRGDARGLGLGVTLAGQWAGQSALLGSEGMLARAGVPIPEAVTCDVAGASTRGHRALVLAVDGRCCGVIEVGSRSREPLVATLEHLRAREHPRARSLELVLVSGDSPAQAERLAVELGLRCVSASASAADKLALVLALQAAGHRVGYVGGGLSDVLALRQAEVAICPARASAKAREVAQIALDGSVIEALVHLLGLAVNYADRQRQLVDRAVLESLVAGAGLIFVGAGLSTLVGLYALSLGVSALSVLAPQVSASRGSQLPQALPAGP